MGIPGWQLLNPRLAFRSWSPPPVLAKQNFLWEKKEYLKRIILGKSKRVSQLLKLLFFNSLVLGALIFSQAKSHIWKEEENIHQAKIHFGFSEISLVGKHPHPLSHTHTTQESGEMSSSLKSMAPRKFCSCHGAWKCWSRCGVLGVQLHWWKCYVTGRNLGLAAVCAKQCEWKHHCQDAQAEAHLHRAILWSLVYRLACGHVYGDWKDLPTMGSTIPWVEDSRLYRSVNWAERWRACTNSWFLSLLPLWLPCHDSLWPGILSWGTNSFSPMLVWFKHFITEIGMGFYMPWGHTIRIFFFL